MVDGKTGSSGGGFIVQSRQNHFVVENCSSSGVIDGGSKADYGDGGICGGACSGYVLIANCWSTGEIRGERAGGIAGSTCSRGGGKVHITRSYSTGDITGDWV